MVSAVLMAGYNNEREVERYRRIVAKHYGERYIEHGYKPLREFKTVIAGRQVSKPLIQYTLEALMGNEAIEEIVIVGHRPLLEERLGELIHSSVKPCRVLHQPDDIDERILRRFNVAPRKLKRGSVTWNLVKGYAETRACALGRHALFVAADAPFTTSGFVNRFLGHLQQHAAAAAIVIPVIVMRGKRDRMGRMPVHLRNDTDYRVSGYQDEHGRQGFRLSSLAAGDLHRFDINVTSVAYSLRKVLNPNVQLRLMNITRQLGYHNLYAKYFLKKDLSLREVEEVASVFFRGRLVLVPMEGIETTYDYDGTDREYRTITEMLATEVRGDTREEVSG